MDTSKYDLIILKVGTNTLMNENGINKSFLTNLIFEATELLYRGKKVIIVTSGAIGLGKRKINFQKEKPFDIKTQQGLAAIGQISLIEEYKKRFDAIGVECAQVLLSQRDFTDANCVSNMKNTFDFLFQNKVIAIVNENDVVATEELRKYGAFSDNDSLASLLAKQLNANLLVMLTTKGGLIGKKGEILKELTRENELMQIKVNSNDGRGGIESKLNSINQTNEFNCDVYVSGNKNFEGFSKGTSIGTFSKGKAHSID